MRFTRFLMMAILLAAPVFPAAQAATSADVTLTLKDRISVQGDSIRLGDVAEVAAEPALAQRLSALSLGEVPGLTPRIFSRESVAIAVHRVLPQQALYWSGATRTIVERTQKRYDGAQLVVTAREYLDRRLREFDPALTRLDIDVQDRVDDIAVPTGVVSVSPQSLRGRQLTRRMCVWLDVAVDGRVYRRLPIWFTVKAYRSVWVATRALGVRENLTSPDVREEERDVTELVSSPYTSLETGASLRTRQAVESGKIILSRDVEPAPAIARHQEVDVQVESGSVRIETKAVAEADGRIGEQISLRNPSNDERFQALVTGAGRARVYVR